MDRKKAIKIGLIVSAALGVIYSFFNILVIFKRKIENDDEELQKDKYEHAGETVIERTPGVYEKRIKCVIDRSLSFFGLIILSPLFVVLSIAIYIDDPGTILFTQKRVGKNKTYFKLHKFRTMKMSTPHDVPTHMLENPEQYITRVGKVLRKYSLDELPQVWDIFVGNMSVIGPRPALWNQYDLIAERDKYGANDVKPGLTGWAQINGRDELEISVKAKFDGEYVQKISCFFDVKCFVGTVLSVFKHDGVVEGGTGKMQKDISNADLFLPVDFPKDLKVDFLEHKKILIAGAGSYIGESFKDYMQQWSEIYGIDTVDVAEESWKEKDFSVYDVVYDVAGIAHKKETDENRHLYYEVNRDLAVEIAMKAKNENVPLFIYLSSMSVYGVNIGIITKDTNVNPINAYGKSKVEAEKELFKLADDKFSIAIVRPPMVYGKGCKGNYQLLRRFAVKFGFFPQYKNERSMLYIDNLSSAIRGIIHYGESGCYFPQNVEFVNTCELVKNIAICNNKKFFSTRLLNWGIKIAVEKLPVFQKVFGTLIYTQDMNVPSEWIEVRNLKTSISITEQGKLYRN